MIRILDDRIPPEQGTLLLRWLDEDMGVTPPSFYLASWLALSEKDQEARWHAILDARVRQADEDLANIDGAMHAQLELHRRDLTAIKAAVQATVEASVGVVVVSDPIVDPIVP